MLTMSNIYFGDFQLSGFLNVTGDVATSIIVPGLSEFVVRVYALLGSIFRNPLPHFENQPSAVDSDVPGLH